MKKSERLDLSIRVCNASSLRQRGHATAVCSLQEHIRTLNSASPPFKISLYFWDDYVEFLNSNDSLMYRYYENVLRYRERYSENEHFFRLLALAFDRPAIRTAFHLENRATDFIEALASLQQLVSTGVLKDRTGHLVDQARPPKKPVPELKRINGLLTKIRSVATEALRSGVIIEHGTVIEIRDPSVQMDLNQLRRDVVVSLNQLLTAANIEPIEVREY